MRTKWRLRWPQKADTGEIFYAVFIFDLYFVQIPNFTLNIAFLITSIRGYQRVGENVTKGKPDMHEAIDVSLGYFI